MKLMSVFLTNLGKYNEGDLVGEWLDLPTDEDNIKEAMKRIGVADNTDYEEYSITDNESEFGFDCDEYTNIYELNEKLQDIELWKRKNNISDGAVKALVEADTKDLDCIERHLENEDFYFWEHWSLLEVAEDLLDEKFICCGLPLEALKDLKRYIDYSVYADELESGNFTETSDGVIQF